MPSAKDWHLPIKVEGNSTTLRDQVQMGKGFAISDGSFCDQQGVAAWIFNKGQIKAID